MPAMPIADSSPPIVVGIKTDQQRYQDEHGLRRSGVNGERLQGHYRQQEDDRQAGE